MQEALVPEDMRRWLPEDHLAWKVTEAVRLLDTSGLAAAYRQDGLGQRPYDPVMMLTLVYYCYAKNLKSTREMAGACTDDVGCRVIGGGVRPSNKAFGEFRRRHQAVITALFPQVLALLKAEGVISGDDSIAAIDGSPAATAAALSSNLDPQKLHEQIAAAEAQVEALTEAWATANAGDAEPGRLWDDDDDGPGAGPSGPPPGSGRKLAGAHRRLTRLKAARDTAARRSAGPQGQAVQAAAKAAEKAAGAAARLAAAEADADAKTARWQQYADAGRPWPFGKIPVPAPRSAKVARARKNAATAVGRLHAALERAAQLEAVKVSGTDPDSRILPAKNGGWLQGINMQASAGRGQVLYAIAIHDSPADAGALAPMAAATDASCDAAGLARLRMLLADCGFASAATFTQLAASLDRFLVAVSKEAVQAGRWDRDGGPPVPAAWQDMAERLADPANKALYKKRGAYVEPFFAQFFACFGRAIAFRGTNAITAELQLRGQVHNLAKLFRHWDRTHRPIPVPGLTPA